MIDELLLETKAGVVAVEDETCFGKDLVTLGSDGETDSRHLCVRPREVIHLAAPAYFTQGLHAPHTFKPVFSIVVAEKDVTLGHHRVVDEIVAVAVHFHKVLVGVTEEHHTTVLAHVPARVEVEFRHRHGVAIEIEE